MIEFSLMFKILNKAGAQLT